MSRLYIANMFICILHWSHGILIIKIKLSDVIESSENFITFRFLLNISVMLWNARHFLYIQVKKLGYLFSLKTEEMSPKWNIIMPKQQEFQT